VGLDGLQGWVVANDGFIIIALPNRATLPSTFLINAAGRKCFESPNHFRNALMVRGSRRGRFCQNVMRPIYTMSLSNLPCPHLNVEIDRSGWAVLFQNRLNMEGLVL
jgi:hypothetical protein